MQCGSNISDNDIVENEVVTEKRQEGRTGIPNRKLSLKTRWIGTVAHVHRAGINKAWIRSGQVLRETISLY